MPTARDKLRIARNKHFNKLRELGGDLSEERSAGANQRTLAVAAKRLINDNVPTTDRLQLQTDAPPFGAVNGVNKTFTLTGPVRGLNIAVHFGDVSSGTTSPLARSDSSPPASGQFFFDINNPSQIVTGDAPEPGDALIVDFITVR